MPNSNVVAEGADTGTKGQRKSSWQDNRNGAGPSMYGVLPAEYTVPEDWANLDEIAAISPVENAREDSVYTHHSLEETRSREQEERASEDRVRQRDEVVENIQEDKVETDAEKKSRESKLVTELYTLSYLVFFAILGTLARVGLTALTTYPGVPVIFGTIWANFSGSLIMGFLIEDRMLFRHDLGTPLFVEQPQRKRTDEENGSSAETKAVDLAAAKKQHTATKKTIPLYIGLATGFCGSFTSFSSFIRDVFLALSNDLVTPGIKESPVSRSGGYSFMALLAVVIVTVCLSLSALFLGAHLAIALERFTPSIRYPVTRKVLDPLIVMVGWGCWLGAILLSIFPPHSFWRGRVVFALVFAPLGCLLRFYLSLHLNGRVASFPMGTFAANVFGTAVLGMAYNMAHVPIGGVVGCQVLQGIEDGFCGALTTISTWVAELSSLRRKHAYVYGTASVLIALGLIVAIMGGLRWSDGFSTLLCST